MAHEAVRNHVQKRGALPCFQHFALALVRVNHSQRVVPIHPLGVHRVRVDARADARKNAVCHGFPGSLAAHAVAVVEHVEDQLQAALVGFVPKLGELIHGRVIKRFPHGAAAQGTVADVADYDAVFPHDLLVKRSAHCDARAAADDRVVGIDAKRREEHVHGVAQPLGKPVFTAEQLRHEPVQQEVLRHRVRIALRVFLNGAQRFTAVEGLHDPA